LRLIPATKSVLFDAIAKAVVECIGLMGIFRMPAGKGNRIIGAVVSST
jgi:hypothetical protein